MPPHRYALPVKPLCGDAIGARPTSRANDIASPLWIRLRPRERKAVFTGSRDLRLRDSEFGSATRNDFERP